MPDTIKFISSTASQLMLRLVLEKCYFELVRTACLYSNNFNVASSTWCSCTSPCILSTMQHTDLLLISSGVHTKTLHQPSSMMLVTKTDCDFIRFQ